MGTFIIRPYFRLQEWVAEEKGYFAVEGLDYEFREQMNSSEGKNHNLGDRVGAYQLYERSHGSNVSCACHAYSVSPSGIFVPPESDIQNPFEDSDCGWVPIRQPLFNDSIT